MAMNTGKADDADPCSKENLICRNNSHCQRGKPNFNRAHRPLGLQTHITSKVDGHHYHCKCPQGYIGHDCSVQVKECSAARIDLVHHCYYGSQCVQADNDSGLLDRYCDCSSVYADEGLPVTGLMCQYKSTSICVEDATEKVTNKQFCANGGKCNNIVDFTSAHPGCSCHHKWEGNHCEFERGILFDDALDFFQQRQIEISSKRRSSDVAVASSSVAEENSKHYLVYLVSACMVMVGTILFFTYRSKKRRGERLVSSDIHFLNEHLGFESIEKSSEVNLSPRSESLDEVDPWSKYDKCASFYTPIINNHSRDLELVETLDDDTSRIIEARLGKNPERLSLPREEWCDGSLPSNRAYSKPYYDDVHHNEDVEKDEDTGHIPHSMINHESLVESPIREFQSIRSHSNVQNLDDDGSDIVCDGRII